MDKEESPGIVRTTVEPLRTLTWLELRERYLDRPETVKITGPSGTTYQVQTSVFWDGAKEGALRVIVADDDGGWRAFVPRSASFIMAPDGSFVDE